MRTMLPPGPTTVYTNFLSGDDGNDGTTPATALKTVNGAFSYVHGTYEFDGSVHPSKVTILMGANDPVKVHFSPHALVGAQGGAALKLDGNGYTLFGGIQFYYGAVIEIRNMVLACQSDIGWGAWTYFLDGVTFGGGGPGHSDINLNQLGSIDLSGNYSISGTRAYHIVNNGGMLNVGAPLTATITQDQSVSCWVLGVDCGRTNLGNVTWALGSNHVVGNKYILTTNHVLYGSANLPGNNAGVIYGGAQAV